MITNKTVWNTKSDLYQKEHEKSHKDKSREYILSRLKQGDIKSVLELGVGSGIFIDNLKERQIDVRYQGVDASDEFIRITEEKHKDVKVIKYDFDEKLPLLDNEYELIYARHVFEHIKHYNLVLKEMARVCSKEIIVVFFRPLIDGKDEIDFRKHKGTYYNSYNKNDFFALANSLFTSVKYIESKGNTVGPSRKGKNWILHCEK